MNSHKYRNKSILNLLQLDLQQKKHQQKLFQINRNRKKIKSHIKQQLRHYQDDHQTFKSSRAAAQLKRDIQKITKINQMNRKINISIQKQLTRPTPKEFRYLSNKRQSQQPMNLSRSRSSTSLIRQYGIQSQNERLMDRILSVKPHIKQQTKQFTKKDFQKHKQYKKRIRKFSQSNNKALVKMVHLFGVDQRLVPRVEQGRKRHLQRF